jgi:hypothetical protein
VEWRWTLPELRAGHLASVGRALPRIEPAACYARAPVIVCDRDEAGLLQARLVSWEPWSVLRTRGIEIEDLIEQASDNGISLHRSADDSAGCLLR